MGALLLRRLLEAMGERGYLRARAVMHPENEAIRRLLARAHPDLRFERHDGLLRFVIPVPATTPWPLHLPEDAGRALARMLRIARTGAVTLPRAYVVKVAGRFLADWLPDLDELREPLRRSDDD